MKLAISNLAWESKNNQVVYQFMEELGYTGLEIAPTKFWVNQPYIHNVEACALAKQLQTTYGFTVISMQSIWYGRQEKLFGSESERIFLKEYTKQAIRFAESLGCRNIVFGCPKNRFLPMPFESNIGIAFFQELAAYAAQHKTVISIEANPDVYGTNYINQTQEALEMAKQIHSKGFRVNLDIGTMIYYQESMDILRNNISWIHHIHISEPNLLPIQKRAIHYELADLLKQENYNEFISIEMNGIENLDLLKNIMMYVKGVFSENENL